MSKWLKPLKVREYYLDSHFDSIKAADKWLYLAVVRGVVRARSKGLVLGPEWIKQLSKMKYDLRCRYQPCGKLANLRSRPGTEREKSKPRRPAK